MTLKKAATLFMAAVLILAILVSSLALVAANQSSLAVDAQSNINLLNAEPVIFATPIIVAGPCDGCSGGGNGGG